jgi:hypothetical protein
MQNKANILEELFTCPICYSVMIDPVTTICGHNFCQTCITMNNNECAYCRRKLSKYEITTNYQIKDNIHKLKQLTLEQTKHNTLYTSPKVRKNKENYYYTNFIGHWSPRYRVKRKFNQINFSPSRVKSDISYTKLGFKSSGIKSQFINQILNDFGQLEDYDLFRENEKFNIKQINYGIDVTMEETGAFSRKFKYS